MLREIGRQAARRGRYQRASQPYARAAAAGDAEFLADLGRRQELVDQAPAEHLYRHAADLGNAGALRVLAWLQEQEGALDEAATQYLHAADRGDTEAPQHLVALREFAGSLEGAEQLYRHVGDHAETDRLRERTGDLDGVELPYQQAAERGDVDGLLEHARLRRRRGDLADAEILAWQTAERGRIQALRDLAALHEQAGEWDKEALYRAGIDRGHLGLRFLALLREQAGDHAGAEHIRRFGLTDEGTPSGPVALASNDLFRRRATPPVTTADSGSVPSGGRRDD